MTTQPLSVALIIGSARGGRLGDKVGHWIAGQARSRDDMTVDVIDVVEHPLPVAMPALGEKPAEHVRTVKDALSARLAAADAFVVVTPEYNHSFPASLKNLIDWHLQEWAAKPVGLVSYGGMGGGLRAAEHLRQVFAEVHAMTVREMVSLHNPWSSFSYPDDAPEGADAAAKKLLDQVAWWGRALRDARAEQPYAL